MSGRIIIKTNTPKLISIIRNFNCIFAAETMSNEMVDKLR